MKYMFMYTDAYFAVFLFRLHEQYDTHVDIKRTPFAYIASQIGLI